MVAAQQQQPDAGLGNFPCAVQLVRGQHEGFDGALQGQLQQFGHVGAGGFAGRGGLGHGLRSGRARAFGGGAFGFFHVGGVAAAGAVDDGVFAGGGNYLEFFAHVAADAARVGCHGAVGEAEAVKNGAVGCGHFLVALARAGFVAVEAVGVFHDEFAPAHQAKARAAFVAELGLYLVEVARQLLVAFEFLAGDVRHGFFAGGLQHEVAFVAVLDAQKLRPHLVEAPCFTPQLAGLHHRHKAFNGAGAVHFLAHDSLYFLDNAQPHGHVGVDARAQLLDHARSGHELVADDFGVRRGFFQGGDEELRGFHDRCEWWKRAAGVRQALAPNGKRPLTGPLI